MTLGVVKWDVWYPLCSAPREHSALVDVSQTDAAVISMHVFIDMPLNGVFLVQKPQVGCKLNSSWSLQKRYRLFACGMTLRCMWSCVINREGVYTVWRSFQGPTLPPSFIWFTK